MGTPPLVPLGATFTPVHPLQRLGGRADAHGPGTARGPAASRSGALPVSHCTTAAPFEGKVRTREQFWLVQLQAIYLRRNPYKLHNVPALMARYQGRELLLYRKVCAAYDLNPTRFYADPAAWQREGNGRGCGKDLVSAEECESAAEDEAELILEQAANEESVDEDSEDMEETDEEAVEEQEEAEVTDCSMSGATGRAAAGGRPSSTSPAAPGPRADQTVASPVRSSDQFWHMQLEAIYRWRNPKKLQNVPKMLEKYRGREALLYRKVCMMYDLDPAKLHAGVAVSTGSESAAPQEEAGGQEPPRSSAGPLPSPRRREPAATVAASSPAAGYDKVITELQGYHRASPMERPRRPSPGSEPQPSRRSPAPAIFVPLSQGLKVPAATTVRHGCIAQPIGAPSVGKIESDAGPAPSPLIRYVRQDALGRPSWKPVAREAAMKKRPTTVSVSAVGPP